MTRFVHLCAAGLGLAAALAAPALAQDAAPAAPGKFPQAKALVVNYERILAQSTAAKDVRTQVEAIRKKMQGDIDSEEAGLRKEEQALREGQATMAPDEFAKKRDDFQKKVADTQRRVQSRNRQLEGAVNGATDKLRAAISPIFSDMMNKRGATVLLDTSGLLYAEPSLDITDQALARLNQSLTKVKVDLPPAN